MSITCTEKYIFLEMAHWYNLFTQLDEGVKLAKNFLFSIFRISICTAKNKKNLELLWFQSSVQSQGAEGELFGDEALTYKWEYWLQRSLLTFW